WVRGDWQALYCLLPFGPTPRGFRRTQLPLISRWKVLDNLRRSLLGPALVAFFVSGWTWLPGKPLAWTLAALTVVGFPLVPALFLRDVWMGIENAGAQSLLQLTLLAYHAYEMVDAIVLTIVRVVITQRRLLEWETAATAAARSAGLLAQRGPHAFVVRMWAGP